MFNLKIIDDKEGHIIIKSDEPCRIEITKMPSGYCLFGYKGLKCNQNQEFDIMYDTER